MENNLIPKYKLYWKFARDGFLFSMAFFIIISGCLSYNLIKNYSFENLIGSICVIALFIVISIFLFLIGYRWSIFIFDDCFIFRNYFGKAQKHQFNDIVVSQRANYFDVLDMSGKIIVRVSHLIVNSAFFIKIYNAYVKSNNLKQKANIAQKAVTCNFYVKNFGIFNFIFGIVLAVVAILSYITTCELTALLIFGCVGILSLIGGIWLLLYYYNWKIILKDNTVCFINFLGNQREVNRNEISFKLSKTHNVIYLFNNDKKIKLININFLQNSEILYKLKNNK